MQPTPILKALTGAGTGSRRRMADAIREGRVQVNEETITDFRHPVHENDRIAVDGSPVALRPPRNLYLKIGRAHV